MSYLFTAVTVEQQEIVAGGYSEANNYANNGAYICVYGDNNYVYLEQEIKLISLRQSEVKLGRRGR
jgi:hypothetical protein